MDGQDNEEVSHHGDRIPDEERGKEWLLVLRLEESPRRLKSETLLVRLTLSMILHTLMNIEDLRIFSSTVSIYSYLS